MLSAVLMANIFVPNKTALLTL
ncbi:unnamed protein product, partial [Rotaria magnacalcarata]